MSIESVLHEAFEAHSARDGLQDRPADSQRAEPIPGRVTPSRGAGLVVSGRLPQEETDSVGRGFTPRLRPRVRDDA